MLGMHGRNRSNVWNYPCANSFSRSGDEGNLIVSHATVKPVAMIADAIMDATDGPRLAELRIKGCFAIA